MNGKHRSLREQRFDSVVAENRERFGRIARVYAGTDAEDLVQEILMQIWRSLPAYNGKAKLATWSYRIALNTAISWQRSALRQKRRPERNRVSTDAVAGGDNESDELLLLQRFLSSLGEVDRAVLLMYLDDVPNVDIAESIGVSEGAIRTRMSRIRDQLKKWEASDDGS